MESIVNFIVNGQDKFNEVDSWNTLINTVAEYKKSGRKDGDKDISVMSWRKFSRIISKSLSHSIFQKAVIPEKNETRLQEAVSNIKKNEVHVIDIAKLDEDTQAFVFGDVVRAIYDLKLGQKEDRNEKDIPSRIIIFIDELNKYASKDIPKNSPILRQILDISERGVLLVLFYSQLNNLKVPFMIELKETVQLTLMVGQMQSKFLKVIITLFLRYIKI